MRTLSVAAALLTVHIALGFVVYQQTALGVDRTAFDLISHVRTHTGVDVVRVLTDFAALPVTAAMILVAAFVNQREGRPRDAIALVVGMIALYILSTVAKEVWDRPRPENRLQSVHGLSYPSGHTAYAVAWLAAATTTRRRALVIAAGVFVGAIGLSRLYLHVHYLTDVIGGAALAGFAFVVCLTPRR